MSFDTRYCLDTELRYTIHLKQNFTINYCQSKFFDSNLNFYNNSLQARKSNSLCTDVNAINLIFIKLPFGSNFKGKIDTTDVTFNNNNKYSLGNCICVRLDLFCYAHQCHGYKHMRISVLCTSKRRIII